MKTHVRRPLLRAAAAVVLVGSLVACASGYHENTLSGGFQERQFTSNTWWVGFAGNGYTTAETVQTYWLYRCAEITLQQGYDGFEIMSPIVLTSAFGSLSRTSAHGRARLVLVDSSGDMQRYEQAMKPQLAGEIRLLKKPFTSEPGRRFDAAALKGFLGPYVTGAKCGSNVCPHVHRYLFPATPEP